MKPEATAAAAVKAVDEEAQVAAAAAVEADDQEAEVTAARSDRCFS